ncbi:zinc finger protein 724-like [Bicyclus anynana]|uniref:Zinc finger protein 724-like n=1 Tax=Bicyclus anynana TaxID=110368 RepID=A0ABM3M2U4_BICAN|nr:zinc finger protein 724-like [Bicyclus anynana]
MSSQREAIEESSINNDPQPRKATIKVEVETLSKPKIKLIVTKKHRFGRDISDILLNTNATPIRCKGGKGYACCFCTNQFQDPKDLKDHTIYKHDDKTKSEFMKGVSLHNFFVKLDITDLKCSCGSLLQNIEDLVQHLEAKHGKELNSNFMKYVVPFKFDDGLKCAKCKLEFNNFKLLMEHMNVHYKNHVCDVCGAGFVNKKTYTAHCYRHQTGTFPCELCPKIFDTRVKQMEHERAIHVKGNKRNKCGYCGDMFNDYTKKNDHEVKVHGAKPIVLACQACDKVFDNQRSLTVHTKTYHLMQKSDKKYKKNAKK